MASIEQRQYGALTIFFSEFQAVLKSFTCIVLDYNKVYRRMLNGVELKIKTKINKIKTTCTYSKHGLVCLLKIKFLMISFGSYYGFLILSQSGQAKTSFFPTGTDVLVS